MTKSAAAPGAEDWLVEQFEHHRGRMHGVAYRMLGSTAEADDALQEAWLRISRAGAGGVDDIPAWLTTVVSRVCLNMLRSRRRRPEESLDLRLPDPIITADPGDGPEEQVILADSVGMALQVVLDTLTPAERLAFVLHDVFGVSFEEIAPIVERTPTTARQLASRARRRVRGSVPDPETNLARQRAVIDAFAAAAGNGDFAALLKVLDPDVVVRADFGPRGQGYVETRGVEAVAQTALAFTSLATYAHRALVNGAAGIVVIPPRGVYAVLSFSISRGRIREIDVLADPERLSRLDLGAVAQA